MLVSILGKSFHPRQQNHVRLTTHQDGKVKYLTWPKTPCSILAAALKHIGDKVLREQGRWGTRIKSRRSNDLSEGTSGVKSSSNHLKIFSYSRENNLQVDRWHKNKHVQVWQVKKFSQNLAEGEKVSKIQSGTNWAGLMLMDRLTGRHRVRVDATFP